MKSVNTQKKYKSFAVVISSIRFGLIKWWDAHRYETTKTQQKKTFIVRRRMSKLMMNRIQQERYLFIYNDFSPDPSFSYVHDCPVSDKLFL